MSRLDADAVRMDLRHLSIPNAARNAALDWPDAEALVDGDGRWTFTELRDAMLAATRASIALGVKPGDRVALWGPNSARWIFAALGIQGAGGILVPLNTRFKADEVAFVLAKSGAKALFSVGRFLEVDYLEMLDAGAPGALRDLSLVCLGETSVERALGWDEFLEGGVSTTVDAAQASIDRIGVEDLSDIMFTSGTTGSPKGVKLTHGQSLRTFGWLTGPGVFDFRPGDRNLVIPPFFHALGYKCGWMSDLLRGATTIPLAMFDVESIVETIQREKVSVMLGPPTLFIDLINHPRRAEFDLSSLRMTVPTAANVPPPLYGEIERELGFETVLSAYGLTEATAVVSTSRPGDDLDEIANSVGRPMADAEVIVAGDDGVELPAGEHGEILIRGYNVMSGYWDDPEATAEAIDPDGWLHTGDIGYSNDRGFLRITDRKKDMVIVGGFNVYPAEVERILAGHEAVAEAAVVGVEDDRFGEVTAAFVILRPTALATPEELIAWSREHMANFKAPRYVEIVDELPRNSSMKVLKPQLRDRARGLAGRTPS